MALKHGEANPLNITGLRRVTHLPPHFSPVMFPLSVKEKDITDWIWENLEGRFFFGDCYSEMSNGAVDVQKCAAFEIPGEASYFALMLGTINPSSTVISL